MNTSGKAMHMLNLRFGTTEKTIFAMSDYFDVAFQNEWLKSDLVRQSILDIDKSTVIGDRVIDSPVLGTISQRDLSRGVKTVILTLFEPGNEYFGTACGDNCAKWFLEVAKLHDINLDFESIMRFPEPFELKIINNGKIIHTMRELIHEKTVLWRDGGYICEGQS